MIVSVGLDVVLVDRFLRALERTPLLAERLFTHAERFTASGNPRPPDSLAARFAAKEATMKALGVGLGAFRWRDVEVVRSESGRPSLVVSGGAAALASEQGVGNWHVSLTHTSSLAGAVVAALS